ncbi:class I SAM-dependent methyltransferase [Moheibacter lacus]|uniref:Methyltransferase domain-containing protein n=1 Tax=Moheibacter lacus TaxID=2745851 RepID=A0A838ZSV6_9FLAO|nr:class I SAM-dependent methyltransferase [Moheibacter lacus]MBA5630060.1 methyltransferase domain-containing protein [Moheibacter lacus]
MKDLMGQAIWDYYYDNSPENLQTETSISELDDLPIDYLFRNFNEMNLLEQKALELTKGKALDIGSGAGSHSLFLQNEKNLEVTALDISPKSIEISKIRGVQNAICANILDFNPIKKFDTILLLMNGTGIFETIDKMDVYLKKLHDLLNENGQILIDGTDILYMYEEEDGGFRIPVDHYYGELDYVVHYKNESEEPIKWLYLDFENLKDAAETNGFEVELVLEEGDSYVAKLTRIE